MSVRERCICKGVEFNEVATPEFNVNEQIDEFYGQGGELIV